MMRRQGFTLAEVLITLGIIGVVAAMTIPTLISNTNGAQFKTAYKKALSTLNQAILMNVALEDYDLTSLVAEPDSAKGADADGTTSKTMSYILRNRMQSATNITDTYEFPAKLEFTISNYTCTADDVDEIDGCTAEGTEIDYNKEITLTEADWSVFAFADGTAFAYNGKAANCSAKNDSCIGFIDVNGATNPNSPIACTQGIEGGTGTPNGTTSGACQVEASGITDIYPVFLYGQTVEPGNDAARSVLFGK